MARLGLPALMLALTAGRSAALLRPTWRSSVRMMAVQDAAAGAEKPALLNWRKKVEGCVSTALVEAFGPELEGVNTLVTPATKPEFGDYQCNVAMSLSKRLGMKPRDVATQLSEKLNAELQADGLFDECEIAGPGFLNIKFRNDALPGVLSAALADPKRMGMPTVATSDRVVVDFSSPNIAKEMHVGHLRSTIIGDCLSRVLEFKGHDVVRLNHVGDWGTQFGMLISYMKEQQPEFMASIAEGYDGPPVDMELGDLVDFYRQAKKRFDDDEAFQTTAREAVVKLQAGDAESRGAWAALCEKSREQFQVIYDLLDVELEERGESFYNPLLAGVISHLESESLLEDCEGSKAVYLDGVESRDGGRQPYIVQKSDGGFLYSTTDLAAVQQRTRPQGEDGEGAGRILYVTDVGQGSHFDAVFQVARKAGLAADGVSLEHVPFGLVQGEDGKKFKTRSGDTVKLKDLLDEAVVRAKEALAERRSDDDVIDEDEVAQAIGIAAVKYADLSMNRESNYKFSYNKMLALQGNTAPYMMYAYARVRGISRKAEAAGVDLSNMADLEVVIGTPEEAMLARQLLKLPEVLDEVEAALYPHVLCGWLFETSQRFNNFYENCPILAAEDEATKLSRAALASLTAEALQLGLGLLGIPTLERI
mmetsp:Transcript_40456/g.126579  ORF Transcript_40456/g.126579 Transcript_40456/m.126579 type:complete len:649 (-) Transcript_40456:1127-3073(-)